MKFWTDKQGNELTFKEFIKRWKEGIKKVVMNMDQMKQVKEQMRFTKIIIIGLILGIGVSIYRFEILWWVMVILIGALGNTSIQFIALAQKKKMLEGYDTMIEEAQKNLKGGKKMLKDKRGQMELEFTPLGIFFGAIGIGIGFVSVWSMSGGGVGEVQYELNVIWKVLIPIATGGICFLIGNKMSE